MLKYANRLLGVLALLALTACAGESPPPATQDEAPPPAAVDAAAVQAFLDEFAREYNAGRYVQASAFYTREIERECGGATDLAHALSQAHAMEGIDYGFRDVVPWEDEPGKADVTVIEDGEVLGTYGFEFAYEGGRWRFSEMYPIAMMAFCR